MQAIYFTAYHSASGRQLFVEESAGEFWVYLTHPKLDSIDKHAYLGSRSEITREHIGKEDLLPVPPMTRYYAHSRGVLPDLWSDDLTVTWTQRNVTLRIDGEPFLFFFEGIGGGFSKALAHDGLYGNAWDQELYEEQFEAMPKRRRFRKRWRGRRKVARRH